VLRHPQVQTRDAFFSSGASHQHLKVFSLWCMPAPQGGKGSLLANGPPEGAVPMLSQLCTGGKGSQVRVIPQRKFPSWGIAFWHTGGQAKLINAAVAFPPPRG